MSVLRICRWPDTKRLTKVVKHNGSLDEVLDEVLDARYNARADSDPAMRAAIMDDRRVRGKDDEPW